VFLRTRAVSSRLRRQLNQTNSIQHCLCALAGAFSGEVETGSCKENASNQESGCFYSTVEPAIPRNVAKPDQDVSMTESKRNIATYIRETSEELQRLSRDARLGLLVHIFGIAALEAARHGGEKLLPT